MRTFVSLNNTTIIQMNAVIYTRVSTNFQDNERQINDLNAFAARQGYHVVNIFSEKISGAKKNSERKELSAMIDFCLTNNVDKVLITELSRLGRDTIEVLKAVELLNEHKISLFIYNLGIETLNTAKEISISSKLMITMLAEFASMERTQIQQRMKSGYDNHRANGGRVGRNKGTIKSDETLKAEHKDIIKYLKQGLSLNNIMKITGKSKPTIIKIKKLM
jgi:DNA invertase Pin-like site-specific DNA recombinase